MISSPKLPQTRLQLRRQTIQHFATGRGFVHRLRRPLGLRMNNLNPTPHRMRTLRLMHRRFRRITNGRVHLFNRRLHRFLLLHTAT